MATAAALAALLIIVLAWGRLAPADRSLAARQAAGVIRIGYAVEAPHAFVTPGGEVTGQSPELAKLVVAKLGIGRIEWRMAEFGALISELEQGRIDVIAAGMFITPERAQRVAFSEPIFHVSQGLLVAKGNPLLLSSYADAAHKPGVRVAVLSGAVEEDMLRRSGLAPGAIVKVPDALTGRVAVENGVAEALALSAPSIVWMTSHGQLGRTEAARPFVQPQAELSSRAGYGAFAFRKSDQALCAAWNAALKDVLASRGYQEIMAASGFSAEDYPGAVSTKEILSR
jgi:ectoine/hydroxyectoine ABC transporter solute-binding protein